MASRKKRKENWNKDQTRQANAAYWETDPWNGTDTDSAYRDWKMKTHFPERGRWSGSHASKTDVQNDFVTRALNENQNAWRPKTATSTPKTASLKAKTPGWRWGIGAGMDTVMNMKQGDDFGTAAVKGIASGLLWDLAPVAMGAFQLASAAPAAINGIMNWKRSREQWFNRQHLPNFGGNYQDTQRAMTMRQAAVQAIQGSKLNARSALGGEAAILNQAMFRQGTY